MFRCDACENHKDKSECREHPVYDSGMLCEECAELYFNSVQLCGYFKIPEPIMRSLVYKKIRDKYATFNQGETSEYLHSNNGKG